MSVNNQTAEVASNKDKVAKSNLSSEEQAIELIKNFLGFKVTLDNTKFTEEGLKEIVEFLRDKRLLKYFPFLSPLKLLVKLSESHKHKIPAKNMQQIVNDTINTEILPGYIITFLQCFVYNQAMKSIKPKDVLSVLSKTKDFNNFDLDEEMDEEVGVSSTRRFVCTAANVPLNEENKVSLVKKAVDSKDVNEIEKIFSGELYPLITDSLFARISSYYASIYQKAKLINKTDEYAYVEVELGGLKALCVFKIQSIENIRHKNKFDKCKFMQEAMVELEVIKINETELKEILKKYIPGASSEQL